MGPDYPRSHGKKVREKLLTYGKDLLLNKAKEIARSLEALHIANQAFKCKQAQRVQVLAAMIHHSGQHGGSRPDGADYQGSRVVTETTFSQGLLEVLFLSLWTIK